MNAANSDNWRLLRTAQGTRARIAPLIEGWADPQTWFAQQVRVIKDGRHSAVGLTELPDGSTVYVKQYRAKSILQRLAFRLGIGRALRCFDISLKTSQSVHMRRLQTAICENLPKIEPQELV